MQAADMFEPFKVLLGHPPMEVETTTPFTTFVERMLGMDGNDKPIAIRDRGTGEEWADDTIKTISFGDKWCLFDAYLKKFGFKLKEATK